MEKEFQKHEAEVDKGYELYQIITDFDNPIEIFREAFQNSLDEDASQVFCKINEEQKLGTSDLIIDIWDDGKGLLEKNIPCFFGLAKSTKVDIHKMPTGKVGYKGHGTKIYFNAERIEIFSKPDKDKPGWGVILEDPIKQIQERGMYAYSDTLPEEKLQIKLPKNFKTGFFVRITNHRCFKTQYMTFVLNHLYVRDYAKWFTVFGTIKPLFHNDIPVATLYLSGLNLDFLQTEYKNLLLDPIPEFIAIDTVNYEKISMVHYFPPSRPDDKAMDNYAKKISSAKPFYDYYSRQIFKQTVHLDNNINFDFIIHSEGYETKRMYDTLLSRRTKSTIDKILQHTDAERYGLWACKGGVPIERIDDWIEGGRGVGTYTYMHAFVDCDSFDLTANRSSIGNTNLEIQTKIKAKINEILSIKVIQTSLQEREDWELQTKTQRKIDEDESELKKRFEQTKKRKNIIFPDGTKFPEPSLLKSGYSESETFLLLVRLLDKYPGLFKFQLLDYNTTDGIDFVVEEKAFPKYIELKGTFSKKINHSFRNVSKFICYDSSLSDGDNVEDVEEFVVKLQANKLDKFESFIQEFHNKPFTSFMLIPSSTSIQSMPVIMLKKLLIELMGAKVE
jgi:hypothetical protein